MSTTSRTSGVSASIRASSSRATPSGSRRARRRSIRCTQALEGEPTLVDETLDALTRELVAAHRPDVVGMTAPFPGNVYGAFRMARAIRAAAPKTTIVLGGGWVNTELRAPCASRACSTTSTT